MAYVHIGFSGIVGNFGVWSLLDVLTLNFIWNMVFLFSFLKEPFWDAPWWQLKLVS